MLSEHNNKFIKSLCHRYTRSITQQSLPEDHLITRSFQLIKKYQKNQISFAKLMHDEAIAKLFQNLPDSEANRTEITQVQMVILLYLTEMLYAQFIKKSGSFLEEIITAKKYWSLEKFYLTHSILRRHPMYSLYRSGYQHQVTQHLHVLDTIENEAAHMLGICLRGLDTAKHIEQEDQIISHLKQMLVPWYQRFTMGNIDEQATPYELFKDLEWIHRNISNSIKINKALMQKHTQPCMLMQNWFDCSAIALSTIAAYSWYCSHQDTVAIWKDKALNASAIIAKEYVAEPAQGLKEILWENKSHKLKPLEPLNDIPEFNDWRTSLINPILNALRPVANQWKNALIKSCDTKLDETYERFIKIQEPTFYLAALFPIVLFTYIGVKTVNYGYNRFVMHNNWHAPMRYALRTIDQLVNSVRPDAKETFTQDGKLYMLVLHLKSYIACLSNEDLMLIESDIQDLLSFELTYHQKHIVVERMYRTYSFLK